MASRSNRLTRAAASLFVGLSLLFGAIEAPTAQQVSRISVVAVSQLSEFLGDAQINNAGHFVFTSSGPIWYSQGDSAFPLIAPGTVIDGVQLADVSSYHVAINDAGTVAFVGTSISGSQAVYTSRAGRTGWSIAFTHPGLMVNDPSLNNAGDLALQIYGGAEGEGIYLLSGGTLEPIVVMPTASGFTGLANENDVNAKGQVVYKAEPPTSIVLVDKGRHILVAYTDGDGQFSLNTRGDVAVADATGVAIYSPLRSSVKRLSNVRAGTIALSDSGAVAYATDAGLYYVRPSPGSTPERILGIGDSLAGAYVTGLTIHRRALNARGELVFTAALSSSRTAVVLAKLN